MKKNDDSWLWNFIFVHLIFWGLKLLHTNDMVKGLPLIEKPDIIFKGCIFGKKHRESFQIGKSYGEKAPLEIINSYICGPGLLCTLIEKLNSKLPFTLNAPKTYTLQRNTHTHM